jgi:hypothetical protein
MMFMIFSLLGDPFILSCEVFIIRFKYELNLVMRCVVICAN